MTAVAYLIKRDFGPANGLDRRYCIEHYRVVNIPFSDVNKWTRGNTTQQVFAVCPKKGDAHPDTGLVGAICTMVRLISGPWVQSDGTAEAIVQCTFDSDRRWGSAFRVGTSESADDEMQVIPGWRQETLSTSTSSVVNWVYNPMPFKRPGVLRIEPRDATGITESQRGLIYSAVGTVFVVFGIPYLFRAPQIQVIKTNQTIIYYRFWTSCPVIARASGAIPGIDVSCPALSWLDEYAMNPDDTTPSIQIKPASSYGPLTGDPTLLPFWAARLI